MLCLRQSLHENDSFLFKKGAEGKAHFPAVSIRPISSSPKEGTASLGHDPSYRASGWAVSQTRTPSSLQTKAALALGSVLLSPPIPAGGGAMNRCLMGNNDIWSQVQ